MIGDRNLFGGNCKTVLLTHYICTVISVSCMFFCGIGCGSTEKSRFYTLAQLAQKDSIAPGDKGAGMTIGIGPVQLPEYLNRPQIVTRANTYEIEISEFHRWGASLETTIPDILAENLSILLSSDSVLTYPWKSRYVPDFQVMIDVLQFDGNIPGNVELKTRWTLMREGLNTGMPPKIFYSKRPIAGQGYAGLVSTMSLVLYDLSQEVADAVLLSQSTEIP